MSFLNFSRHSPKYISVKVKRSFTLYLGVAQLVACLTGGQEAGGSSPLTQTIRKPTKQWVFIVFIKKSIESSPSKYNKYATLGKQKSYNQHHQKNLHWTNIVLLHLLIIYFLPYSTNIQ